MSLRLHARKLACERDGRWLFHDLDLDMTSGDILCVEGPNGSGKTTLLKILSGQSDGYQGAVHWGGQAISRARQAFLAHLLYLGHAAGVKLALTARENLAWYAALGGVASDEHGCDAVLERVGLAGIEDLPAGQLSAGQQRRIALARLLLTPRPLWVLDEPFTALDPAGAAWLETLIGEHADRGGMVVLSSHRPLPERMPLRRLSLGQEVVDVVS